MRRIQFLLLKLKSRKKCARITVIISLCCVMSVVFMYKYLYYNTKVLLTGSLFGKDSNILGWSARSNRDIKIYVLPDKVTTITEPADICPKKDGKNKLFLLIIVCSATVNFEERIAIRETWGNYDKFEEMNKIFKTMKEKYKNYNFTYDELWLQTLVKEEQSRNFSVPVPHIVKTLKKYYEKVSTGNRYSANSKESEDTYDPDQEKSDNDFMKPSDSFLEGHASDSIQSRKLLSTLDVSGTLNKTQKKNLEADFKIVFLLGLPNTKNVTSVQEEINKEIIKYGDIIQESFIDTYHNLTIKSVMMLKWITRKCNESVRYILKTDDDMYVNLPHLMWKLRNISQTFDLNVNGGKTKEEHLLLGHLFKNTQPIHNASVKWYSPRYMYSKKLYPPYLSGIGYVFTMPTAQALYKAAFVTKYFHLEDVYITGLCPKHSKPRQSPQNDPTFENIFAIHCSICCAHAHVTVHRAPPRVMRSLHAQLMSYKQQDKHYIEITGKIPIDSTITIVTEVLFLQQERERRMCVLYQQLGLKADECSAKKIVINATADGKFEISVKF